MKKMLQLAAVLSLGVAYPTAAEDHANTIADIAMASPQHETLVAAVKAADLAGPLMGAGPLTVFAPTDQAFTELPTGTVQNLLLPENKAKLQAVLTYHVVPGRLAAADILRLAEANGGTAELTTLEGGTLQVRLSGDAVTVVDENGGTAKVLVADLQASNGFVHVTDAVSLPR